MRPVAYLEAFVLPLATAVALYFGGWLSYLSAALAFVLIPVVELFSSPDTRSPGPEREKKLLSMRAYDWLLYMMVPVHVSVLIYFLFRMGDALAPYERIGMISSMGIQCGSIGINVAHELGHRLTKGERFLARIMLLTSLYMHFIVEHNRGHHKYVGTPQDPATARLNESIYAFWFRTVVFSFISAWNIERKQLSKKERPWWHPTNEMIWVVLIEAAFVFSIYALFGLQAMVGFLVAALIGILLLETVNYIEHYGLMRKEIEPGKYERVQSWHSWNSDYPIGRIILFELTRHSDHHYMASRKYQILRHLDESPQLPTGYPGAMLLSLVPPIWFRMMNKRIPKQVRTNEI